MAPHHERTCKLRRSSVFELSLDRERRTLELGGALLLAAQIENSLPLITLV